jgi:hypothetical protein
MPDSSFHAFALKNAGLDAFLYADVGTELNGSMLTTLSMLARLGQDPWAKAADWAALSDAAGIDDLSQSIAQMPLTPASLAGSRDIAARLLKLLPGRPQQNVALQAGSAQSDEATSKWFTWFGLAAWMFLNVLLMQKPAHDTAAPVEAPATVAVPNAPPVAPASHLAASGTLAANASQRPSRTSAP